MWSCHKGKLQDTKVESIRGPNLGQRSLKVFIRKYYLNWFLKMSSFSSGCGRHWPDAHQSHFLFLDTQEKYSFVSFAVRLGSRDCNLGNGRGQMWSVPSPGLADKTPWTIPCTLFSFHSTARTTFWIWGYHNLEEPQTPGSPLEEEPRWPTSYHHVSNK